MNKQQLVLLKQTKGDDRDVPQAKNI